MSRHFTLKHRLYDTFAELFDEILGIGYSLIRVAIDDAFGQICDFLIDLGDWFGGFLRLRFTCHFRVS